METFLYMHVRMYSEMLFGDSSRYRARNTLIFFYYICVGFNIVFLEGLR
jgi:hypothetical protein